jgi:CHASE1-domain containing sensor protein
MPRKPRASSSSGRAWSLRSGRSLGGFRTHAPSAVLLLVCAAVSIAGFLVLRSRASDRQRAAFNADAAPVVANLRSAFVLPLEVLSATTALFESSQEVTRAEFARFVKPALERYPGIRALEWIPVVPFAEREKYELAARADGLGSFGFRELTAAGSFAPAGQRSEYLPIFFMEPGHPLVLGFDCGSEPIRHASAERARTRGAAAASERIRMLDDPPSLYSIAVFEPVFEPARPRSRETVRGLTVEVFRVRSLAERALSGALSRGIQVALYDLDAAPDKRLLFESDARPAAERSQTFRLANELRFADRNWSIVLTGAPDSSHPARSAAWFVLIGGLVLSGLSAFGLSAVRTIQRLRKQVRTAQQLGQYTLLERLGQGGMGVVYKAKHALLRRPTAIKLLAGQDHDARQLARFEREVQLTSELTHPNTIAIFDYGRTPEGTFYYAMEYVDGLTFEQLVQNSGALPAARVCHLLEQAAGALAEAHDIGLIHRDIKPANLMLCCRGGVPDVVKVMDFGLVKATRVALQTEDERSLTLSGTTDVLGTPSYLAPEAIMRPGEIDARADLYALGAVAYFLLVGSPLFTGNTFVEICGHHLYSAPPRPSERAEYEVPPALEKLVLRCLEKDPEKRFASARVLRQELIALCKAHAWSEDDAVVWWRTRGDSMVHSVHADTALAHARTTPEGAA